MCSEPDMFSELECGICYQPYNAGGRGPRQLPCRHTFCESCLVALLARPSGTEPAGSGITCPLCRRVTLMSRVGPRDALQVDARLGPRDALPLDARVFERMVAAGVLDDDTADDDDVGSDDVGHTANDGDTGEHRPERHSSPGRGGKFRRSLKTVWGKITGDTARRSCRANCMSDDDFRDFAMMTCYMF